MVQSENTANNIIIQKRKLDPRRQSSQWTHVTLAQIVRASLSHESLRSFFLFFCLNKKKILKKN